MHALLLVDLQYDFMPGGPLGVPQGDAALPVANAVLDHFELVVATQDWHPADHGSFVTQNPGLGVGDITELGGLPQVVWPVHCIQGSRGAELHHALNRTRIDRVFRKGTDPTIDSYSGFYDNGHRKDTGLSAWLRQREVDHVVVMGLALDYCVKFTALDAVREGFKTTLLVDGCRAVNLQPGDGDRAVEEMRAASVEITPSRAFLANACER